jgi:hypothetical protein
MDIPQFTSMNERSPRFPHLTKPAQDGKAERVVTIYVELLDECVACWRPVDAAALGADRYRLLTDRPDDEVWPFDTGDVVRCEIKTLSGNECLVACAKAESAQ